MKTFTPEELKEILYEHAVWLHGQGKNRADLHHADLHHADLHHVDLSGANLSGANLSGADLRVAKLRDANLSGADLHHADLHHADLRNAILCNASLSAAGLIGADLRNANLYNANLHHAHLSGADLSDVGCFQSTIGNGCEIVSLQTGRYDVTYTATHMQIGCQLHTLEEWWRFSDIEIDIMDGGALDWWSVWKPILQNILTVSPAAR